MTHSSANLLDAVRAELLGLPRVAETMQWGSNLVFWTLDKAVGGKMFAIAELDDPTKPVLAFAAGPDRAPALLENEGIRPATYLARAHWVALEHWQALPAQDLLRELRAAYAYVGSRMPTRVQRLYDLPAKEYRAMVRDSRAAANDGAARRI